ncbi:M50 family metallopeptidase [Gulosibacter faecalis]|jgi:hypothetical protein|uniref:M50 family metallopeptidase n=1 Tax=Gulosibacter faecalis TaxID=272240 RepID=A0ABW5UY47_9MICO|nr:M50 family metallopeptidase [Gulosibacter faecalis]
MRSWLAEVWSRIVAAEAPPQLHGTVLLVALVAAAAAVGVPALWRILRIAVTLVHELGHAMVGMLVGRKFTGFVLNGDMSGHAVTSGPARGAERALTTWAGYPAPAIVGAALVWLGGVGWSAPALTVMLGVLLVSLVRVRSWLTLLVMLASICAVGALWWWGDDDVQAATLLAVGLVLVVGAWRHLGAVWGSRNSTSDPAVLAQLTRVPALVWNASFALVCLAATALCVLEVWPLVRP